MDGDVKDTAAQVDIGERAKVEVKDEAAFLELMRKRAQTAVAGWSKIHDAAAFDLRFLAGEGQWEETVKNQRMADERPCLTINQLPKYCNQVIGDALQNKIEIKVRPVGFDRASNAQRIPGLVGQKDYSVAEAVAGIIRNIQQRSKAERAYDHAIRYSVRCGLAWLFADKRWAKPNGFEQEIYIGAKRNPFAVLMDPAAMFADEPDFAAARYAFEHVLIPKEEARARYGEDVANEDVSTSAQAATAEAQWWFEDNSIRIARYWYVEDKKVRYVQLSNGAVMEEESFRKSVEDLKRSDPGIKVVAARAGVQQCVYVAKVMANRIIEGPFKWDGHFIPLIPVLGEELYVEGKMQYWSLIRHSHDAQRQFNYWRTSATETVALAPKAPIMAPATALAGREDEWKGANRNPKNVLLYNWTENMPAPSRLAPPQTPAAEISQALQANNDLMDTIGMYQPSLGQRSNETSGKAILARQREGDTGTFSFHDNLAKGVEQLGRVVLDLLPSTYDTPRIHRLALPEDGEDFIETNLKDLNLANYDVAVSTGPSFTTRRMEAVDSMIAVMQAAPDSAQLMLDLLFKYMDWPGADQISTRLKKTLPPHLLEPSEAAELAKNNPATNAPPGPQEITAATEAEAKHIDATAKHLAAQAKLAQAQSMDPERIKDMIAQAIADTLGPMLASRPSTNGGFADGTAR